MHGLRVTRLDTYVLRQLLVSLTGVTAALVALIWLTQSLHFIELVVNRGLSLRVFLQLTGLLIPNFVAVILPITSFVVVQFAYQRLASDRELTVMRAAGLSPLGLSRPAIATAILTACTCLILNIWVVPASYSAFRQYQFEIRNRMAAFLLQEGVFTPISDQLTVYVRSRDRDGLLRGIVVEDDRQKDTRATILAEQGRLLDTGDAPSVVLYHGSREQIDRKTGRLDVLTFNENVVDLSSTSKNDETRYRDATEMSLAELLSPDPSLVNARDVGKFEVEAHRRLTAPLTAISFSMVALVAVLTGDFRRYGNLFKPLFAVLTVVGLLALGLAISNVAARHPVLIPAIWLHAAIPGLICAWILYVPRRGPSARDLPRNGEA